MLKNKKSTLFTKEQMAGLCFNIKLVDENFMFHLQQNNNKYTITDHAIIYLTATLEYLTAEIHELSGIKSKSMKIKKKSIDKAISNDTELRILFAVLWKRFSLDDPPKSMTSSSLKVLKQVHPDMSLSLESKKYVNQLLNSILKIIAYNTILLHKNIKQNDNTINVIKLLTIESAIKLSLTNELLKHSVNEGQKAVTKYISNK